MTTHGQIFDHFVHLLRTDRAEAQRFLLAQTQQNPHTPANIRYLAGYSSSESGREICEALREFGST